MPDGESETRGQARVVAFAFLAAVMLVVPAYGQLIGGKRGRHVGWRMFTKKATDFCAVDYWQVLPGGERRDVDRFELLGYTGEEKAPLDLWRIPTPRRARQWGRKLCAALGPGADVRVDVRCATEGGWQQRDRGDRNLCPGPDK